MQQIKVTLLNEQWILDARKCCYWPKHECLIIADLHLEKARALSPENLLPQYDSIDTLKKLAALLTFYRPKQVVCLGDSFHTVAVAKNLPKDILKKINNLIKQVNQWIWISGNHDPELPSSLLGERYGILQLDDITFTHEPLGFQNYTKQLCGHYHPKVKIKMGMQKIGGACFVANKQLMILPSLGSFTGGLSIDDPAINQLIAKKDRIVYLIANKKIWTLK